MLPGDTYLHTSVMAVIISAIIYDHHAGFFSGQLKTMSAAGSGWDPPAGKLSANCFKIVLDRHTVNAAKFHTS